jgi:aspartyl-tRNA(Asn)/glutamyl-tRNA(Gln) amidotransferase subunit A
LHGVGVAVKDNIDVAGMPSGRGCPRLVGVPRAGRDAAIVADLRRLGAIVVGKTATHQFAYGPTGDRTGGRPTRNPHDRSRMSGGSSGGSAAAVASGMVPLAGGTDTGGSVRIPAALCGVVGFKPAFGRISVDGTFPLAPSLDHVGLLADSVATCADAARALGVVPPSEHTGPVKVRWLEPDDITPTRPAVARIARAALTTHVPDHDVAAAPWAAAARAAFSAIQDREAASRHAHRARTHPHLIDPEVLERIRRAAATTDDDYRRARQHRDAVAGRLHELFAGVDLLACPTTAVVAPLLGQRHVDIDGGITSHVRDALLGLTSPWNLLGLPAITLPAGHLDALPVGLQLIARPGAEPALLTLAGRIARPAPPPIVATSRPPEERP